MAGTSELDYPYEASDEASENELLDRSLSVWRGWSSLEKKEDFAPIYLDLYTASSLGQYDCVRAFIQKGEEDLNRKNRGGWTPLMYASYIGHDNVVNLLLDAGVKVNVCNNKGQTSLMLAACCGNESVAYFLIQQEAEIEVKDRRGWTALFHATYSGHTNMVRFLLDSGANMEAREPTKEYTPFMLAAAEGHEIIVQIFLNYGVSVNAKACMGDTGRSLALLYGHMKIVSMIDNHNVPAHSVRAEPGLGIEAELSSSDEAYRMSQRHKHHNPRVTRSKVKGPNIRDGPEAFAKLMDKSRPKDEHQPPNQHPPSHRHHHQQQQKQHKSVVAPSGEEKQVKYPNTVVPHGYVSFENDNAANSPDSEICFRDVTSPINPEDHTLDSSGGRESNTNEDEDSNAFSKTGALTIKSSSSSSGGLVAALGISRQGSADSNEEPLFVPAQPRSDETARPEMEETNVRETSERQTRELAEQTLRETLERTPDTTDKVCVKQKQCRILTTEKERLGEMSERSNQDDITVCTDTELRNSDKDGTTKKQNVVKHTEKEPTNETTAKSNNVQSNDTISLTSNNVNPPIKTSDLSSRPEHPASRDSRRVTVATEEQNSSVEESKRPKDLSALLTQIGLVKYMALFEEQDVDLQVFLSLTDDDLKEVGVKLFGPRRKMTNAIARWHSNAPCASRSLEQAYADRLESEMQEMAIQLHQANLQTEQYNKQLLQEQELRSVTEGWLMEDKAALQHIHELATDTHARCDQMATLLHSLRTYHSEVCRRCSGDDTFAMATPYQFSSETGSSSALRERLDIGLGGESLDRLTTTQLLTAVHTGLDDLSKYTHITAANMGQLLGQDDAYCRNGEEAFIHHCE